MQNSMKFRRIEFTKINPTQYQLRYMYHYHNLQKTCHVNFIQIVAAATIRVWLLIKPLAPWIDISCVMTGRCQRSPCARVLLPPRLLNNVSFTCNYVWQLLEGGSYFFEHVLCVAATRSRGRLLFGVWLLFK